MREKDREVTGQRIVWCERAAYDRLCSRGIERLVRHARLHQELLARTQHMRFAVDHHRYFAFSHNESLGKGGVNVSWGTGRVWMEYELGPDVHVVYPEHPLGKPFRLAVKHLPDRWVGGRGRVRLREDHTVK